MTRTHTLRAERLPNGLIRVFDMCSKLAGCYESDGTYRHGDLRLASHVVRGLVQ